MIQIYFLIKVGCIAFTWYWPPYEWYYGSHQVSSQFLYFYKLNSKVVLYHLDNFDYTLLFSFRCFRKLASSFLNQFKKFIVESYYFVFGFFNFSIFFNFPLVYLLISSSFMVSHPDSFRMGILLAFIFFLVFAMTFPAVIVKLSRLFLFLSFDIIQLNVLR